MQNVDLAWLAGIIDGEGCFSIYTNVRSDAENSSISASLTITNSNKLLIDRCMEILDSLDVKYYYHDPKNGHQVGRRVMRIRIKNYSSLKTLVELLTPYLIGKIDQAEIFSEFVNLAGQRGKLKYEERTQMMNKVKKLNQHGHLIA